MKIFWKTSQKPMSRQIEWEVQNRPITKSRVLPATTLLFWKFCFSLRTSNKELSWCTNCRNVHIYTFRMRLSFIWGCFFRVSILKSHLLTYLLTGLINGWFHLKSNMRHIDTRKTRKAINNSWFHNEFIICLQKNVFILNKYWFRQISFQWLIQQRETFQRVFLANVQKKGKSMSN